ncbi:MAG TPA: DUF3570 domain-containing protein [Burkholderiales bacterium]|nr:DUF3570 domain-containing protein [Burkholderiales bacterium]
MRLQLTAIGRAFWLALAGLFAAPARGVVLPEDRGDLMYHYYNGGGTKVDGPALLVRKGLGESVSAYASYFVDNVSCASIDVVTTASPFKEKRTEYGGGVDYLYRNTTLGVSVLRSSEPDYLTNTLGVTVSHEIFDGLTTVSLGYAESRADVGKSHTDFSDHANTYQYKLGVSQVVTKSVLATLNYEAILQDGYLQSPYRSARLLGLSVPEVYPRARDGYAVALGVVKGIGPDEGRLTGSAYLRYRYFWDTWDIRAQTLEAGFGTRVGERWLVEPRLRHYSQSAASFYSDNFAAQMTFMARDRELSDFTNNALGVKASYQLSNRFNLNRMSVTLDYEFIRYHYNNFTDVRTGQLYAYQANVFQLYVSGWF